MKRVLFCTLAALMVGCVNVDETTNVTVGNSKDKAVIENIMTRRSIRDYKEEPVCREQMAKILEAGIYAPSAMNLQTWAVRVVDNKEFIDGVTAIAVAQNPKIAEQPGFRNIFRNAPTVAFVACPEESYSGEYDCGLLSQNMIRYGVIVIAFGMLCMIDIGNPLAAFAGIMGLKAGAYLQPFTHKISTKFKRR